MISGYKEVWTPLKRFLIELDDAPTKEEIAKKYKKLVATHYKEPDKNFVFNDCTKDVFRELLQGREK